jgi:hypothetical protein
MRAREEMEMKNGSAFGTGFGAVLGWSVGGFLALVMVICGAAYVFFTPPAPRPADTGGCERAATRHLQADQESGKGILGKPDRYLYHSIVCDPATKTVTITFSSWARGSSGVADEFNDWYADHLRMEFRGVGYSVIFK